MMEEFIVSELDRECNDFNRPEGVFGEIAF
jgi:hypothetical protein